MTSLEIFWIMISRVSCFSSWVKFRYCHKHSIEKFPDEINHRALKHIWSFNWLSTIFSAGEVFVSPSVWALTPSCWNHTSRSTSSSWCHKSSCSTFRYFSPLYLCCRPHFGKILPEDPTKSKSSTTLNLFEDISICSDGNGPRY